MTVLDCRCNGEADKRGRGGVCTDGKQGRWCHVDEHACNKRDKFNDRFFSFTPCKKVPNKPCECNGKTDRHTLGGPCENEDSCYVNDDANCTDIEHYNGKSISKEACKGIKKTLLSYFSVKHKHL